MEALKYMVDLKIMRKICLGVGAVSARVECFLLLVSF